MATPTKKLKPLSHLKKTDKGSIHHVEIHPAKNSKGGQAFRTLIQRNRPAAQQAAMDKGGPYVPSPEPEETLHEDGQDMLDHVGRTYGVKAEDDGDEDED